MYSTYTFEMLDAVTIRTLYGVHFVSSKQEIHRFALIRYRHMEWNDRE